MKFCLLRAHCMYIIQIMRTILCVLYVMICNSVHFVWILIIQVRIVHLSVKRVFSIQTKFFYQEIKFFTVSFEIIINPEFQKT